MVSLVFALSHSDKPDEVSRYDCALQDGERAQEVLQIKAKARQKCINQAMYRPVCQHIDFAP